MFYSIYKLTNKHNGKFYIGITSKGLQHRFNGHLRKSKFNPSSNLHQALAKYGEESFEKETIHSFESNDKKQAYSIEQEYITKYDAVAKGYDMDIGYGWACANREGSNNPMWGKISGNAHKVIIKDIEYPSISKAAELLSVNRSTVDRWINNPNKPDCFKVLENRKGLSDPS